jgi:regulator of cell morphogenesis and NO signaling
MTVQNDLLKKTSGQIVSEDFRTAPVFSRYGIDFCCGGKMPVGEACKEKGIAPDRLIADLSAVREQPADKSQDFNHWSLTFLADFILNTHHVYLKENLDMIAAYTGKIAGVHGDHHPEAVQIAGKFVAMAADMKAHLREEEEVFFPLIKQLDAVKSGGTRLSPAEKAAFRKSFEKLDGEHLAVGDAAHQIRHMANDYAVPADVCNTYAVTMQKLKEFENDLHKHVHLENNILFPKAIALAN